MVTHEIVILVAFACILFIYCLQNVITGLTKCGCHVLDYDDVATDLPLQLTLRD